VERQHRLQVSFFAEDDVEPSSHLVSLSLFRIAQEALRNSHRHGRARRAAISLERDAADLVLKIVDDGQGFDVEVARQNGGLGLVSIAERGRMVKAAVSVHSDPGHGTTVDVRVPASVADRQPEPDVDVEFAQTDCYAATT
jgi:signal transduction histidine kinase